MRDAVPEPARASEDDRFVAFYRAEYPSTVRLAFVLTSSTELAEDVAQEAFARVHHRLIAWTTPPPTSGSPR